MFYKVVFLSLFFVSLSFASNALENIKSFQANFVQIIKNSSNKTIEYKGEIFIKEPSKILWKYKEPIIKNVFVINSFAIVDEPELEQAIFTSLDNEIDIIKLLKSAKEVKENTFKAEIKEVEYLILVKENKISSISYKDQLENSVVIEFSEIKQNMPIEDKTFSFNPPSHYDIIRK